MTPDELLRSVDAAGTARHYALSHAEHREALARRTAAAAPAPPPEPDVSSVLACRLQVLAHLLGGLEPGPEPAHWPVAFLDGPGPGLARRGAPWD